MEQHRGHAPHSARHIGVLAVGIVALALVAAFGVLALTYRTNAAQLHLQLTRERQLVESASSLRYGVVESVQADANSLTVLLARTFEEEPRRVLLRVLPTTFIAHQELRGEGGLYSSLSPLTPVSLAQVSAGMRAAFLLDAQEQGQGITARVLIIGNPL